VTLRTWFALLLAPLLPRRHVYGSIQRVAFRINRTAPRTAPEFRATSRDLDLALFFLNAHLQTYLLEPENVDALHRLKGTMAWFNSATYPLGWPYTAAQTCRILLWNTPDQLARVFLNTPYCKRFFR
jgi:hypothetical protein